MNDLGTIEGYRSKSYFNVFECANCGTSRVDPSVADEKIYDTIYENPKKVPGYARYHSLANQILRVRDPLSYIAGVEESYYAVSKKLQENVTDKRATPIVEVGCGQGYLTYALVRAGFDAVGVDISKTTVALARKRYGDYYYCGNVKNVLEGRHRSPEYIVATELIEHLPNPILFVSEMLELLSPGGFVLLTTPNKLPCNDSIWQTELPPVHLWWFTKNGLTQIANRLSCEISFVNLTDFYASNLRYRRLEGKTIPRTPVLNEKYELIQPIPEQSFTGSMKGRLRDALPISLVTRLRRLQRRKPNSEIFDGEHPGTLCAVFKKTLRAR
jgi:SAM-dependent methyltransferase